MADQTNIEWANATWNPWRGCTKVSPGCLNCYAEAMSGRNPAVLGEWGEDGNRAEAAESYWNNPFQWNRSAAKSGKPLRVFFASLADVFEDRPDLRPLRWRAFDIIQKTPHLTWLLLTKRPELIRREIAAYGKELVGRFTSPRWDSALDADWCGRWLDGEPPENVWLGTSVENQEYADLRIPHLLSVPAKVHWLSVEPLLGPIEFSDVSRRSDGVRQLGKKALTGIDWVIVGGESGSGQNCRPMDRKWAISIRDQCVAAGVPFFFKQWGDVMSCWNPDMPGDTYRELDAAINLAGYGGNPMFRVGKNRAGRMLDERTWDEVPV